MPSKEITFQSDIRFWRNGWFLYFAIAHRRTEMNSRIVNTSLLIRELHFIASRSGGPGGQNVNKVNSKISVRFDIPHSEILTEEEKAVILQKLSSYLTKDGTLHLSSQEKRSQLENKHSVLEKLDALLSKAFEKRKARKKSKPSAGAVQKRIQSKKLLSEKKKWRQKPDWSLDVFIIAF